MTTADFALIGVLGLLTGVAAFINYRRRKRMTAKDKDDEDSEMQSW